MTTIADVEDAFLDGSTVFQDWLSDFEMRFYMPMTTSLVGAALASADPQTLEMLRAMNPEGFDQVNKIVGRR